MAQYSGTAQQVVLLGLCITLLSAPAAASASSRGQGVHHVAVCGDYAQCGTAHGLLQLSKPGSCTSAFEQLLLQEFRTPVVPAPHLVPEHLQHAFAPPEHVTFNGGYMYQQYNGAQEPYYWTPQLLESLIEKARARTDIATWANKDYAGDYRGNLLSIYSALDAFAIKGMSGLVYGSETPWVEAILFSEGAAQVTTVEYHPIQSSYSKLHTMHPHDLAKKFAGQQLGKYDFAVSYSSLEHAGLGRYGDFVNPYADLEEVHRIACVVKPDGLLFVGVPVGPDQLSGNLHRIYGKYRLPMLTANWELLGIFDRDGPVSDLDYYWNLGSDLWFEQPVLVLRNSQAMHCTQDGSLGWQRQAKISP